MNAVTHIEGELFVEPSEFFAPMASDLVDGLIGQYRKDRERIESLAAAVREERHSGVLHHFIEGNCSEQRHTVPSTVGTLFALEGAIAHLNGVYWGKALKMTDVLDYMPQKRRSEWYEQIHCPLGKKERVYDRQLGRHVEKWVIEPLPDFTEETVRATLAGLLSMRSQFFSERVDGIFRALSREHVTNRPEGFSKRMILQYATSCGTAGVINDLRCVIAKFMGRDEPKYGASDAVIKAARRHSGQWMSVDGNAFRIRVYNGVDTAHIEVHPDMAWRLNAILANLYPQAIPPKFREKPKRQRKIKDFELFERPLPFAVIGLLAGMSPALRRVENAGWKGREFREIPLTRWFGTLDVDKHVADEAGRVLEAIGGVREKERHYYFWRFDYEPSDVLDEIVCSGRIPDHKSHQFYPTPDVVADAVIEAAEIGADDECLEPSAGTGSLARRMPKDRTLCVEISALHAKVLEAQGLNTICADFLAYAKTARKFDRVIMNPPFSQGRWQAHLEAAAGLVADGGRLVAVLPASAKNAVDLPGFDVSWSGTYANEFEGTGVTVAILVARRKSSC